MGRLGFDLTFENIERLADIINTKEISEFTIEEDDFKFTIKGKKCPPPPPAPMSVPMNMPMGVPAGTPAAKADENTAVKTVSGKQVKAPIVGTFYAAPSPKDKPFVSVGQQVKKGDVVFIIESMKVMSEIQSEYDGIVKEICVNDGDSVEYDQTVIILE